MEPIEEIISLCRKIQCTQRVVQYCAYVYKRYRQSNDSSLAIPASVLLGCKLSNYIVDIRNITDRREEVVDIELDMCRVLDFDFNYVDIYNRVIYYIEYHNIPKTVAQYVWIFVNDSVYISGDDEIIILACINLAYMVGGIKKDIECNEEIEHTMSEILKIYELE